MLNKPYSRGESNTDIWLKSDALAIEPRERLPTQQCQYLNVNIEGEHGKRLLSL